MCWAPLKVSGHKAQEGQALLELKFRMQRGHKKESGNSTGDRDLAAES